MRQGGPPLGMYVSVCMCVCVCVWACVCLFVGLHGCVCVCVAAAWEVTWQNIPGPRGDCHAAPVALRAVLSQ